MMERRTLTPTQIRYLKIGPKAGNSKLLKKQLVDILELEKQEEFSQTSAENGNMNKIPKFTFGQFQKTVNNFGVLINKNFGTQTTLHQMQKFGKLAHQVDKNLHNQKDKPLLQQKNQSHRKGGKLDKRTFLKSIYNYNGQKIFVMLHSFSIQVKGDNYKQFLNFQLLKMLLEHVSSSKLAKIVQNCLSIQNQSIGVDENTMYQKTHALKNNQQKYQGISYKFQKLGAEFKINLPYIQFSHIESDFKQVAQNVSNKDILQIVSEQFDNVHDIVFKYFDHEKFILVNGPIQTPTKYQEKQEDRQSNAQNEQIGQDKEQGLKHEQSDKLQQKNQIQYEKQQVVIEYDEQHLQGEQQQNQVFQDRQQENQAFQTSNGQNQQTPIGQNQRSAVVQQTQIEAEEQQENRQKTEEQIQIQQQKGGEQKTD